MNITISVYDSATGEFTNIKGGKASAAIPPIDADPTRGYKMGKWDTKEKYVDVGGTEAIIDRPSMGLSVTIPEPFRANGADKIIIGNVPVGTDVRLVEEGIDSPRTGVCNDSLEYTTEVAGKISIYLKNFPYLQERFIVYATGD